MWPLASGILERAQQPSAKLLLTYAQLWMVHWHLSKLTSRSSCCVAVTPMLAARVLLPGSPVVSQPQLIAVVANLLLCLRGGQAGQRPMWEPHRASPAASCQVSARPGSGSGSRVASHLVGFRVQRHLAHADHVGAGRAPDGLPPALHDRHLLPALHEAAPLQLLDRPGTATISLLTDASSVWT